MRLRACIRMLSKAREWRGVGRWEEKIEMIAFFFRAVPKIPSSRLSISGLRRMLSGNLDGSVVRFYEDKGGVDRAPFRISL